MVMLEAREHSHPLASVIRKGTEFNYIRSQLMKVDAAESHAVVAHNGTTKGYTRSRDGNGWIEDGVYVRESIAFHNCAVVSSGTKIPEDAIAVYGGVHGNTYVYSNYD